ncbi:MAG: MBOAT family protein, partial [Sedimenticola thiotaurini]
MLFNSYYFIFLFLPIVLAVYFLLLRKDTEYPIVWLVFASLFFYGWWNPVYLFLIIASMVINYALGWSLSDGSGMTPINRKRILVFGIALNLSALGYYKYAGFFIENIKTLITNDFSFEEILLPLAISFFTFQQIAYLVDAYRGITKEYRFIHYALFVTFFPQLIAGPIVHHKEMLPQFLRVTSFKKNIENFSIGITIFTIGLFKKSVLADNVAQYSTPVFDAAATGDSLSFFVAWGGAMAYTMQLYFDFSGYSDMAIGGARLFGIKLPLNFHSPYKATTIVEFWRRWHMTLSRFLRDYLYIPLGGN